MQRSGKGAALPAFGRGESRAPVLDTALQPSRRPELRSQVPLILFKTMRALSSSAETRTHILTSCVVISRCTEAAGHFSGCRLRGRAHRCRLSQSAPRSALPKTAQPDSLGRANIFGASLQVPSPRVNSAHPCRQLRYRQDGFLGPDDTPSASSCVFMSAPCVGMQDVPAITDPPIRPADDKLAKKHRTP